MPLRPSLQEALAPHAFVVPMVGAVLGEPIVDVLDETAETLVRLAENAKAMRLNTQYGLVPDRGIYVAVPYKYANTPRVESRYRNVDANAVLTALGRGEAVSRILAAAE